MWSRGHGRLLGCCVRSLRLGVVKMLLTLSLPVKLTWALMYFSIGMLPFTTVEEVESSRYINTQIIWGQIWRKGAGEVAAGSRGGVPREKESERKRAVPAHRTWGVVLTWGTVGAQPPRNALLPPHSQHSRGGLAGGAGEGEEAQAASPCVGVVESRQGKQARNCHTMPLYQSFQGRAGALGWEQRAQEGGSLCGAPARRPHLPRCALQSSPAAGWEGRSLLIPPLG